MVKEVRCLNGEGPINAAYTIDVQIKSFDYIDHIVNSGQPQSFFKQGLSEFALGYRAGLAAASRILKKACGIKEDKHA